MIEAHELTKRYGDTAAVHSLSFTIAPGTVTGFLGPNGAGKSTTMRMIMGLDRPTSGTVTVNGKPYRQHRAPLREVGALLEASAVHPGRSARSHLRAMAATHNIKASRVSEVFEMTGLAGVATKRVGGFSLGMGQRLGIAAALLGDPRTLILDEPVNGLDPEGDAVQLPGHLGRARHARIMAVPSARSPSRAAIVPGPLHGWATGPYRRSRSYLASIATAAPRQADCGDTNKTAQKVAARLASAWRAAERARSRTVMHHVVVGGLCGVAAIAALVGRAWPVPCRWPYRLLGGCGLRDRPHRRLQLSCRPRDHQRAGLARR
jgi:ABC-2 type transport system ATP-binding protein